MNKKTEVRTIKRQHQKYSYRRNALVATLEKKGIKNQKVLQAIETVPRHSFVDSALVNRAYNDRALHIGCSQTISQPYTVANQTALLDTAEGAKVLEIGRGPSSQATCPTDM